MDDKKQELKAVFYLGKASARLDQLFKEIDEDDTELEVVALNAKNDLHKFTHWYLDVAQDPPLVD